MSAFHINLRAKKRKFKIKTFSDIGLKSLFIPNMCVTIYWTELTLKKQQKHYHYFIHKSIDLHALKLYVQGSVPIEIYWLSNEHSLTEPIQSYLSFYIIDICWAFGSTCHEKIN